LRLFRGYFKRNEKPRSREQQAVNRKNHYLCQAFKSAFPNTSNISIFMTKDNMGQAPAINIEISEEVAEGIYSNLAIISHSNAEFVMDFIRMMPNMPKAKVKARIVLTPQHAKRLMYAMRDNIQKFEMQFGKIEEPDLAMPPMNFGAPVAQA
jgi:hypothetical protein